MVENELYHHGRKGQKWGKRNGPPYPLEEGDFSAEEKKHLDKYRNNVKKELNNRINK